VNYSFNVPISPVMCSLNCPLGGDVALCGEWLSDCFFILSKQPLGRQTGCRPTQGRRQSAIFFFSF